MRLVSDYLRRSSSLSLAVSPRLRDRATDKQQTVSGRGTSEGENGVSEEDEDHQPAFTFFLRIGHSFLPFLRLKGAFIHKTV